MSSFLPNTTTTESRVAGADLPNRQFRFVKLLANGRVVLCDTAGERAYGVILNRPKAGETAQISLEPGGSELTAGAVLAIGDELTTDNLGRAIKATADKHYVNAIAMSSAAAAGNTIGAAMKTYQKNV